MADIKPFRGVLYNPDRIKEGWKVTAPPYDVISPEAQDELMARDEANVVRLILPKDENSEGDRYQAAAKTLQAWLNDGILVRDDKDSIYLYEQEFTVLGKRECRVGFLSLVKLEDFDSGVIKPHENTLDGPKADRFNLMTATNANMCSILGCYSDPGLTVDKLLEKAKPANPIHTVNEPGGDVHRLYRISDEGTISTIVEGLKSRELFIADGHHRYETALKYRNTMREKEGVASGELKSYDYMLMYLANMDAPGVKILAYNRCVRPPESFDQDRFYEELDRYFKVAGKLSPDEPYKLVEQLAEAGKSGTSFGVYRKGEKVTIFSVKPEAGDALSKDDMAELPSVYRDMGVTVLHTLVIEGIIGINSEQQRSGGFISYFSDPAKAIKAVDDGKAVYAFLLNPVSGNEFTEISNLGLKMPQKSTFFYPKLLSGLVINIHNG